MMKNKLTFAIVTVAIAAVVPGLSTIVLDNGIQIAFAQTGYPPTGQPSTSQGPGDPQGPPSQFPGQGQPSQGPPSQFPGQNSQIPGQGQEQGQGIPPFN
jgi:hypothetical protein